jgi:hypothetical protein
VFVEFGVGTVDQTVLGAALRGEGGDFTFAEDQHWKILEALNLEPTALTRAFRSVELPDLPGAVLVGG